jgi:hypothetical protein
MTEVEAVERILRGEPFKGCMHCDGVGTTPASRQRYKDAVALYGSSTPETRIKEPKAKDYTQLCMRCKGTGTAVEETYAEACRVLGKELPKPGVDYSRLIKDMQEKAGDIIRRHMQDYYVYGNAIIDINAPKDPNDDR